jgi:hypothetical protein
MKRASIPVLASLLLLAASACAGYPPPNDHVAIAEASIRGAMEAGATDSEVPRAQLHLRLAQEQTEKARRLMNDGENEKAEYALRRAESDAELATAIAREQQLMTQANEAKKQLAQLKAAPR